MSSGLYFYYQNNWQQKSDQLAQFEEKMNQPLKVAQEVRVQLDETTKQKNKEISIRSPFESQLKFEQLQQEIVKQEQESSTKEETTAEATQTIRPSFKLLGILRNNGRTLVTMAAGEEIKRLTLEQEIKGFSVVEVNINNVVLQKEQQQFKFWLGQQPQDETIINQVQGGNQN